jgi:tetratricopeptide (TPR) repeat protein
VAKRHLTRKEIKQPDQFVSYTVRLIEWVKSHANYLLYGMLGIAVIVGLLVVWALWKEQQQQQAEILLYEAVKILNPDGEREDSRYGQALAQLQRITEEFGTTPAAASAYWHLGHLYYDERDFTAALTAYRQAQRRFSHHHGLFIPVLITLDIGYAQEASGLYDIAIDSFEQVLQSSAHWLRGEAFLGLGRCYEKNGATAKAITTYERALTDNTVDTMSRKKIEEHLAQLRAPKERVK